MLRSWREPLAAVVLAALVLAAHGPALRAGFIWDDDYWLGKNAVCWAGQAPWGYWVSGKTADYLPVTGTFFWLQRELWGEHPAGYHAVNLLLHALAVLGLWRVLRGLEVPGAWLAAAIFAVHPVTVASTAWVAEQKNTLSLVLLLGSLLAWLGQQRSGRRGGYILSLILFALALGAKASVVIFPAVLTACLCRRRGRLSLSSLAQTVPFWLLALLAAIVTVAYQHGNAMGEPVDGPANPVERLVLAARATWFYAAKTLAPINLSMIYPRWDVHTITAWGWLALAALLAAMLVLLLLRKHPAIRPWTLGLGYYLLALLPTLGLVNMAFMMHSFVADHWQYLALPGLIALLVSQAWFHLDRRGRAVQSGALMLAAAVIVCLGILCRAQAGTYRSQIAMWRHTLEVNPAAVAAHVNLAAALAEEGKHDEAMAHYLGAMRLQSDKRKHTTFNNIGLLYARQEHYEQAVENYRKALEIDPHYADCHFNLAVALAHLEQFEPAAQQFARALQDRFEEDPPAKLADRHEGLASALVKLDKLDEALAHYNAAIQLAPNHPLAIDNRQKAWHMMALKHAKAGRLDKALACFDQALAVAPRDGRLWLARGEVLLEAGKLDQARPCFVQLEELEPGWAKQSFREATQREAAGDARQAIDFYRKATLARPGYAAALNNLAWLLATTNDDTLRDGKQAVTYAQEAVASASAAQRPTMQLCLSAAYAQAGQGPQAVAAARQAQELEKAAGRAEQVKLLEALIAVYQRGQTYRDYVKLRQP